MRWIAEAFQKTWFYVGALLVGVLYGLGGVVHVGNMLGFGEVAWTEAPMAWRVGDIWWGTLDFVALVGIAIRSPVGVLALALAAASQVVVYSLVPEAFALTESHRSTLRGLVYFNTVVLIVMVVAVVFANRNRGT